MSAPQRRKGKPNRGGGRFNSSRGSSGGRGRGRGGPRGRGRGGGHGAGGHGGGGFCGGKKGGDSAAAMGYLGDSVVVGRDEYDDYDHTPRFVTTLEAICLHIYHLPPWFFHSVRSIPSLNCLDRRWSLAILGHAGPRWWIRLSLHLVLGLPCCLVNSRGVHSVTFEVHLLSLNRVMCPAYSCIPFLITN